MTNELSKQKLAEKIGALLAASPIDEEIKSAIMKGLDKLPFHMAVNLLEALENESQELEDLVYDLRIFLRSQELNWQKTAQDQKNAAATILNKWEQKLKP